MPEDIISCLLSSEALEDGRNIRGFLIITLSILLSFRLREGKSLYINISVVLASATERFIKDNSIAV